MTEMTESGKKSLLLAILGEIMREATPILGSRDVAFAVQNP